MNQTATERRRARVLQVAYACSPWQGSEPGAGWHRAVEAAKYSDIWVICEGAEFEHQILGYLHDIGGIEGLHFRFVRKSRLEQRLSSIPATYYLAYRLWQRRAFQAASALHEEVQFDLVHQVNLSGYREPGKLGGMNLPFVWGPVGGTQRHPWIALSQAGLWGGIQESVRSMANSLRLRFSRRVHRAVRRADLLLAANSTNQADFERIFGRRVPVLCETGSPTVPAEAIPGGTPGGRTPGGRTPGGRTPGGRTPGTHADRPLRLLWAGNLEACHALPLLLRAVAMLPGLSRVELRVVGDGPQRKRWGRMADDLGISDRMEWIGSVPEAEMQTQYLWADLLTFTSLRDSSTTVVFEALARGVPVLAVDHQGVGDIVTAASGIKIPVGTPLWMSAQYRRIILALTADRPRLEQLSAGALRRAAEFAWSEQGKRMRDYYQQLLGANFDWESRVENECPGACESTWSLAQR